MRPNALAWQRIKVGINHTVFGLSGTIFNFAFSVIIVRLYSAELWGSFARIMLLLTFISQITSWGNKDYLVREFSRNPRFSLLWQTSLVSRALIFLPLIPVFWFYGPGLQESFLFALWCLANFGVRSFDSAIIHERRFKAAVLVELAGFAVILVFLFLKPGSITLGTFMALFAGSSFVKSLCYFLMFRNTYLASFNGAFSRQYLIISIPYFLPPFISFLNAKADTFAIALTLTEKEVGEYYVLVSLLSYCHAIAALALVPFLKNIYRIKTETLFKIKQLFFLCGLAWIVICMAVTYVALEYIYQIHLDTSCYLVSALAMPPFFIYYLLVQEFFKNDRPYPVVAINLVAALINFTASLVLIHILGFLGGLISFAVMQWVILLGFRLAGSKFLPSSSTTQQSS